MISLFLGRLFDPGWSDYCLLAAADVCWSHTACASGVCGAPGLSGDTRQAGAHAGIGTRMGLAGACMIGRIEILTPQSMLCG